MGPMSGAISETDQASGAAHPRHTFVMVGHEESEASLDEALQSGRMHHAWMLCGPRGVGKATLAYRTARIALGAKRNGSRPFDLTPEDPIARRIGALSHPDLFVLRRGLNDRGKPRSEITIDEARALGEFFSMKPAEGGMRVAVIDSVDELNRNAANAILKTLEEPPPRCLLLLICHAPGAALATIRSRCRRLTLRPLSEAQVIEAVTALGGAAPPELAAAARGCPGRAVAMASGADKDAREPLRRALERAKRTGAGGLVGALLDQEPGKPDRRALLFSIARDLAQEAAVAALETPGAARWAEAYSRLLDLEQEAEGLDLDDAGTIVRAARLLADAAA